VASLPARNTTLRFSRAPLERPVASVGGLRPRARVLVVEENIDVANVVAVILEEAGYEVLRAREGAGAVASLREAAGAIDLALVDVNLPAIKRWRRVAVEIKALSPGTKVLYMSGVSAGIAAGYGVVDSWFIEKPFTSAQLLDRVARQLNPG
jgi:two-component system, cell cycle sensor histidine kinase and response regulator CckA